jgi:hypothetical protein
MFNEQVLAYPFNVLAVMRIQEFYENPEFKGQIVSRERIEDWNRKLHGKSYAESWDAFNFPVTEAVAFFAAAGEDLHSEERQLKAVLETNSKIRYVISAPSAELLRHEQVHALFYLNSEYHKTVHQVICSLDLKKYCILQKALLCNGYSSVVIFDEINAYLANDNLADIGLSSVDFELEIKLFDSLYEFYLNTSY